MAKNENEISETEAKKMFEIVLWYSKMQGYPQRGSESFIFFGSEEWVNYCNDNNEDKCPQEWIGNAGTTDPSILVVPIGTFVDDENEDAVTWGVFRNAGIKPAANFLAGITSFSIPYERRATVAKLAAQIVMDERNQRHGHRSVLR